MASFVAARVAVPTFAGLRAQANQKVAVTAPVVVSCAPVSCSLQNIGKALVAGAATLALTASANAAVVKMGGDDGSLVFSPASVSVSAGEAITFKNNSGFPHNVVFDEDAVPAGVSADAISHEDYFNAAGEEYSVTLSKPGVYEYYCEPHQGAGMSGKITVS
eukprot:TRINITY_DN29645_c0_g1_i1.p1 TRINITY_DN29645_c0_g1~~TRINITY_DN29645_c0_g1_i1.p1  ORF type:complete len:162 (+),score=28.98 TRINITY_DN29645_c0_g1_i1:96-581(+)